MFATTFMAFGVLLLWAGWSVWDGSLWGMVDTVIPFIVGGSMVVLGWGS